MKLFVVAVLRVVTVVFDATSVITCTWLLWKVPAANRRFLLPKQIVNLALADALVSTMDVAVASTTGYLKEVLINVMNLFVYASLLLEVHVSFGFLALYWRKPTLVMFLKRIVWLTWVTAAFIWGVASFMFLKWGFASDAEFFLFTSVTALVITVVIYIMVWFRSCFFPFRELQRALRMLSLYPATFLFTWVPPIMCVRLNIDLIFGDPFIALNGVLNVLLYSCQTRFSGSVWCEMEEERGMSVAQWGGRSSLPVGFSMSAPLEVHVPAVQRMALDESEREIADIERTRADIPAVDVFWSL